LLDYVEAMRLSTSYATFATTLKKVRYRSGLVAFDHRNHFFTDWAVFNTPFVSDVTSRLGGNKTRTARKALNSQANGAPFLPGIPPQNRTVEYIPSASVDNSVTANLKTGDYAGIYSEAAGLDVSHVGIIVRTPDALLLRHASSQERIRMVIDEGLNEYLVHKPGLVVMRPLPAPRQRNTNRFR
jgi:hypothetical protein